MSASGRRDTGPVPDRLPLTWAQSLTWRSRRHELLPPGQLDAVGVVRRLAGVQAQVPSASRLAVAARQADGVPGGMSAGLSSGVLLRTWAMRGTLHVLAASDAADQLALIAAARTWHRGAWQRNFAPLTVIEELADHVTEVLDGSPLTRDELVAALLDRTGDHALAEQLRSGWSGLLKPLAWQGLLCQGAPRGRSVTFTRPNLLLPGWTGLPDPDDAGPRVVRQYVPGYGPATMRGFDQWLLRGANRTADLRRWFAALGDELVAVDVEGREAFVLAGDLDELIGTEPEPDAVVLLPGFDQYVLGPGTGDVSVLPAAHRPLVSRAAGWISPVVLLGGRMAGVWQVQDGLPVISPFPGVSLPAAQLAGAVQRMADLLASADPSQDPA